MGVVEDVRQVLQDVVAPDLKALQTEVEEIEKRIGRIEGRMQTGFQDLEAKMQRSFQDAEQRATERHTALMNSFDLQTRVQKTEAALNRLEAKVESQPKQQ